MSSLLVDNLLLEPLYFLVHSFLHSLFFLQFLLELSNLLLPLQRIKLALLHYASTNNYSCGLRCQVDSAGTTTLRLVGRRRRTTGTQLFLHGFVVLLQFFNQCLVSLELRLGLIRKYFLFILHIFYAALEVQYFFLWCKRHYFLLIIIIINEVLCIFGCLLAHLGI